ncbi:TRAP transporter permease [Alkalihalobacterium elongatum]|uniref:TRAP transporter permease n=1 Tax=Alkalihalobacterium elongatum TaxID=2675466 RepID=UPI001C1F5FDB|nr:TRAP transporter permease [Alkalihalobacterium elongatum]
MAESKQSDVSNVTEVVEEEKTRQFTPWLKRIVTVIAVSFSLYQLYATGISSLPAIQHRAIHLSFALLLIFILYPVGKGDRKKIPWFDIAPIVASVGIGLYIVVNYMELIYRAGAPNTMDKIMAALAIVLTLEACRRTMGNGLTLVALFFVLYNFLGQYIPGPIKHNGFSLGRVLEHLYLTSEGIYGVAIYVTSTFVFTFILFGAFLQVTGGGKAFIDLAFAMTGRYRGGPAKAAVFSSGFMGSISGSSFANVATTGIFTIPLMKKVGYKPEFSGGVEAASSSGGQIMPPVMGAAAFIMAEMTGITYNQLILYAALPAILYFFSVFLMVDFRAAKNGLKGLSKEEIPNLKETLKRSIFVLIGPIAIVAFLLGGFSPIKASFYALIIVIIGSYFRKDTRLTLPKFIEALEIGAKNAVGLIAACAAAGLIVGTVTLTGIGVQFADMVVILSQGSLIIALILTMVASIILGMGLPTAALYIILATMAAPALINMGVALPAAHLFIFYYGCMAAVTPPVALSSFLAAGIAKAKPMPTSFQGLKLSLAAFLLPFIFAANPALLFYETTFIEVVLVTVTSVMGIVALAASLEGYFLGMVSKLERITLFLSAILMLVPGFITDVFGITIILLIAFKSYLKSKKQLLGKSITT